MEKVPLVLYPPLQQSPCVLCDQGLPYRSHFNSNKWLQQSGLATKPDKTEVLFFQKSGIPITMPASLHLILPDQVHSTFYMVSAVVNLRYLGFFIICRLKWEPHIWIMCN